MLDFYNFCIDRRGMNIWRQQTGSDYYIVISIDVYDRNEINREKS